MAMVKITNGDIVTTVPSSAFKNVYSKIGFTIVSDEDVVEEHVVNVEPVESIPEPEVDVVESADVEEFDEDEAFLNDIVEKPISQWSAQEIKKYAVLNDIDLSSAKRTSEARNIVKKFMEESNR